MPAALSRSSEQFILTEKYLPDVLQCVFLLLPLLLFLRASAKGKVRSFWSLGRAEAWSRRADPAVFLLTAAPGGAGVRGRGTGRGELQLISGLQRRLFPRLFLFAALQSRRIGSLGTRTQAASFLQGTSLTVLQMYSEPTEKPAQHTTRSGHAPIHPPWAPTLSPPHTSGSGPARDRCRGLHMRNSGVEGERI